MMIYLLLNTHVQPFHNQTNTGTVAAIPQPPQVRPRVRARRGQATDPHSIAERVISHLWTQNNIILIKRLIFVIIEYHLFMMPTYFLGSY